MADHIRLQHGTLPWEGSGHHVETYHYHDAPLIGVIEQDEATYLFKCEAGEVEPLNLWSYTYIEPHEVAQLEATETDEDFDALLDRFSARPGVAAVALDGFGVIAAVDVYDWAEASKIVARLLDEAERFVESLHAGVEVQRHRLVAAG